MRLDSFSRIILENKKCVALNSELGAFYIGSW